MANEYPIGKIHKLVGENKEYYLVGTYVETAKATIVEIIEDTNFLSETGVSKFMVIVENNEKIKWVYARPQGFSFTPFYSNPKGTPENFE